MIYPGEIRAGRNKGVVNYSDDDDDDDDDYRNPKSLTKTDYESDTRFTYNIGITFGGNINQRLNASLTAEIIIQRARIFIAKSTVLKIESTFRYMVLFRELSSAIDIICNLSCCMFDYMFDI